MKKMYVSGPYSGTLDEINHNISFAEIASVKLLKCGWCVLTPHKNYSNYEKYEEYLGFGYEYWLYLDLELLSCCDAIFMLKSYKESKGAMIELEKAIELGLEIYYESEGYPCP
jgi:hypothetical protein